MSVRCCKLGIVVVIILVVVVWWGGIEVTATIII